MRTHDIRGTDPASPPAVAAPFTRSRCRHGGGLPSIRRPQGGTPAWPARCSCAADEARSVLEGGGVGHVTHYVVRLPFEHVRRAIGEAPLGGREEFVDLTLPNGIAPRAQDAIGVDGATPAGRVTRLDHRTYTQVPARARCGSCGPVPRTRPSDRQADRRLARRTPADRGRRSVRRRAAADGAVRHQFGPSGHLRRARRALPAARRQPRSLERCTQLAPPLITANRDGRRPHHATSLPARRWESRRWLTRRSERLFARRHPRAETSEYRGVSAGSRSPLGWDSDSFRRSYR